jgi:hypothetical protein
MGFTTPLFRIDFVAHGFHSQYADFFFYQLGKNKFPKAAEVRIHYIQRHLHCIEMKLCFAATSSM